MVWLCGGRRAVIGHAYQPKAERDREMEGKWNGDLFHLHPSLPISLSFSVSEELSKDKDKALVSRAAGLAAKMMTYVSNLVC